MNVDTPPPLNEAATGRPSIIMRPSLARPPFAVNIAMNGVIAALPLPCTCSPGMAESRAPYVRVAGTVLMTSLLSTAWRRALCVSTIGVSPVTVTVSATEPTRIATLMGMTPDPVTSMPSRLTVVKPGSVTVIAYVPGGNSVSRYCPVPSVVAVRTFWIRAGLVTSTVTPGSTASDASRTTPASVACANAVAGMRNRNPTRTVAADTLLISGASCGTYGGLARHAGQSDVRLVYTPRWTARSIRKSEKIERTGKCSVRIYTSHELPRHRALRVLTSDLGRALTGRPDHHAFFDHVDDVVRVHRVEEEDLVRLARGEHLR